MAAVYSAIYGFNSEAGDDAYNEIASQYYTISATDAPIAIKDRYTELGDEVEVPEAATKKKNNLNRPAKPNTASNGADVGSGSNVYTNVEEYDEVGPGPTESRVYNKNYSNTDGDTYGDDGYGVEVMPSRDYGVQYYSSADQSDPAYTDDIDEYDNKSPKMKHTKADKSKRKLADSYLNPTGGDGDTYGMVEEGRGRSSSIASLSSSDDLSDSETGANQQQSKGIDFMQSFFWNERFQVLLERPTVTPEEARQRLSDIDLLTTNFIEVAKPIVEKIVTELSVSDDDKTIKPCDAGGVAGGEKFMTKQLFLKFAKDNIRINLYNGDDWAQKAALHELKSLNSIVACGISNLHTPLMAMMSCYGHYVVVVSKLPLSATSLVYGSADAARTIKQNHEMEKLMKQVAQKLNIRGHEVIEGSTGKLKTIHGPVDIEGHKGLDGRYYVVDTARVFPPSTPIKGVRGCHLYKLLRAELVRSNPVALSSDAFSFFGKTNSEIYNAEVVAATNRIFKELIPKLLEDPLKLAQTSSLTDMFHSYGINMRFIGAVLKRCLETSILAEALLRVVVEISARAFKALLFRRMRNAVAESDSHESIDSCCRGIAADLLAQLLTKAEEGTAFWRGPLADIMKERFVFHDVEEWVGVTIDEAKNSAADVLKHDLRAVLFGMDDGPSQLLKRATALAGIVIPDDKWARLDELSDSPRVFEHNDVIRLEVLAKRVQVIPFVESYKATGKFKDAEEFYLTELKNRVKALGENHPQVASTRINLAELYAEQPDMLSRAKEQFDIAEKALRTSFGSNDIEVVELSEKKADLLAKYDQNERAFALFEAVLAAKKLNYGESHPEVASVHDKIARTAAKLGRFDVADGHYQKSLDIKTKEFGEASWQLSRTLNGRAQLLFAQGKYQEALPICINVRKVLTHTRGKEHSEVGIALDNLARVYAAINQREKAYKLYNKSLSIKEAAFGQNHTYVAMTLDHTASNRYAMLVDLGSEATPDDFESVANMYERAMSIFRTSLGENHSAIAITLNNLARLHEGRGRRAQALELFERSYGILKSAMGPNHELTKSTLANMEKIKRASMTPVSLEAAFHAQHITSNADKAAADTSKMPEEWKKMFNPTTISAMDKNKAQQLLMMIKQMQSNSTSNTIAPAVVVPAPVVVPVVAPITRPVDVIVEADESKIPVGDEKIESAESDQKIENDESEDDVYLEVAEVGAPSLGQTQVLADVTEPKAKGESAKKKGGLFSCFGPKRSKKAVSRAKGGDPEGSTPVGTTKRITTPSSTASIPSPRPMPKGPAASKLSKQKQDTTKDKVSSIKKMDDFEIQSKRQTADAEPPMIVDDEKEKGSIFPSEELSAPVSASPSPSPSALGPGSLATATHPTPSIADAYTDDVDYGDFDNKLALYSSSLIKVEETTTSIIEHEEEDEDESRSKKRKAPKKSAKKDKVSPRARVATSNFFLNSSAAPSQPQQQPQPPPPPPSTPDLPPMPPRGSAPPPAPPTEQASPVGSGGTSPILLSSQYQAAPAAPATSAATRNLGARDVSMQREQPPRPAKSRKESKSPKNEKSEAIGKRTSSSTSRAPPLETVHGGAQPKDKDEDRRAPPTPKRKPALTVARKASFVDEPSPAASEYAAEDDAIPIELMAKSERSMFSAATEPIPEAQPEPQALANQSPIDTSFGDLDLSDLSPEQLAALAATLESQLQPDVAISPPPSTGDVLQQFSWSDF